MMMPSVVSSDRSRLLRRLRSAATSVSVKVISDELRFTALRWSGTRKS
jgi:hypothetical protein